MRPLFALFALSLAACVEPALERPDAAQVDAGPWRCSPMTCAGCCSANTCRGGNELDACGYDGRSCQPCRGATACVAPGTCASLPSDGGSTWSTDGGSSGLTDPYTGQPLQPPTHRCVFIFGSYFCN